VGFKEMLRARRRQINGDPIGRARRVGSSALDVARWPLERGAWAVERRLLWPLQRRLAGRRPSPGHGTGAAALAAIGVAAILVVVLILPGRSEPAPERAARPTRVAIVPAEPKPQAAKPQPPTLQGAPPRFGASHGGGGATKKAGGGEGGGQASTSPAAHSTPTASASTASEAADSSSGGEAAASASSAKQPVPAGPAAMKVARRFSEAFVAYEIGKRQVRAKAVFGATATPRLAKALAERPPRLPSNAKVPKAKVVNLVPGPRAGRDYTVSVSLLRVGLTSELRLELGKKKGVWLVTDVRG